MGSGVQGLGVRDPGLGFKLRIEGSGLEFRDQSRTNLNARTFLVPLIGDIWSLIVGT